ncbi:MAG: DsrE/DsrF/DrsH-like family protein [Actinobacteria bacterium]|jgi:peroxiredoxin family protein|nr:DsrE/DsrF/DrsH-like family protein [Actinomycetota bacterium]
MSTTSTGTVLSDVTRTDPSTLAGNLTGAEGAAKRLTKLAIIVREGAYDRILTPLAFGYLAAAAGADVDMLFVNWAVRAVMKDECNKLPMSAEHSDDGAYIQEQVAKAGLPPTIEGIVQAMKATGKVHIYVCSLAAQIFGATRENLLDQVDDIVGATWFLTERSLGADITQYF